MNARAVAVVLLTLGLASPALAQGTQPAKPAQTKTAVFAGGCFWCVEEAFDKVDGVIDTISGYTGGKTEKPTYKQVTYGNTGHFEAVKVDYDPAKVTYAKLLETFWHNIDPLDPAGQFCDKGSSYKSAIFVADEEEKKLAEQTKQDVAAKFGKTVATDILPVATFYPAEDDHQDYHTTNPVSYKYYKWNCGRAQRLEKLWGSKPPS